MHRLSEVLREFFDSKMLNPHGICLLWRPELLFTHAVSDIVIGAAYFSIPIALAVFLDRRRDVRFSWVVWMFVAFILLCGLTHFMMVWTLWHPDYGVEALFKATTAIVSMITAVALWPLLPKVIALPSTTELEARVAERDAALDAKEAIMATMVEMREHERRQALLINELNHRVKNTLSSVQSIAVQTLKAAPCLEAGRNLLVDRLIALSALHNLLVSSGWDTISLREVIASALSPYGKPYVLDGADVSLRPNVSITLGMALHELSLNATRFGAWNGNGEVLLTIVVQDNRFILSWIEKGGPEVTEPEHRGFGRKLLERGVATELNGFASLRFKREGVTFVVDAPLCL